MVAAAVQLAVHVEVDEVDHGDLTPHTPPGTDLVAGRTARFERLGVVAAAVQLAVHVEVDEVDQQLTMVIYPP